MFYLEPGAAASSETTGQSGGTRVTHRSCWRTSSRRAHDRRIGRLGPDTHIRPVKPSRPGAVRLETCRGLGTGEMGRDIRVGDSRGGLGSGVTT